MKKLIFLLLLLPITGFGQISDAALTIKNDSLIRNLKYDQKRLADFNKLSIDSKPNVTASYSNPSWINTLAWSKITSTPTTLAGYGITDPIVLTSGSYSNPSWITSFAWSKITGPLTFSLPLAISDAKTNSINDINYVSFLSTGVANYRRIPLIDDSNLSARSPGIKGNGQVVMTNGSASITGIGTDFNNATFFGESFWTDFWVKDSGGNWYRGAAHVFTDDTHIAFNLWYTYSTITATNNVNGGYVATASTTFPGVSGTYDWYIVQTFSDKYGLAFGSHNIANNYSVAFGGNNIAVGQNSFAFGSSVYSGGTLSFSLGFAISNIGNVAFAGGQGNSLGGGGSSFNKSIIASGNRAFIWSENNASQTAGNGALANNCVILGGLNHNIASGNVRAAIIGGSGINLTGTTYIDVVAVPSLAIFTTPSAGSTDDFITWNSTTKILTKVATVLPSKGGTGVNNGSFTATLGGNLTTAAAFNVPANAAGVLTNNGSGTLTWGSIGGGITNTAANNEFPKSNGTNIVPSGLFSSIAGNLDLGTTSLVGDRIISAPSSSPNNSLFLRTTDGSAAAVNALQIFISGTKTDISAPPGNISLLGSTYVGRTLIGPISGFDFGNYPAGLSEAVGSNTSSISTVLLPFRIVASANGGAPANGFGVGMEFAAQNSASTNVVGSTISSVSTNVTPGTEAFSLVFSTMTAGAVANEKFRITSTGIGNNTAGFKHSRVTTGSVTSGATALVTITWATAFADANYTVSASVIEATTSSLSMSVVHVESITASSVTVRVLNNAAGALTGTLNVIAVHD